MLWWLADVSLPPAVFRMKQKHSADAQQYARVSDLVFADKPALPT